MIPYILGQRPFQFFNSVALKIFISQCHRLQQSSWLFRGLFHAEVPNMCINIICGTDLEGLAAELDQNTIPN